jgi:7-cyano-7-deazaguanine synthase
MRVVRTALLLSSGMDSLCLAWWKRPNVAITLDYGQLPAQAEIAASSEICRELERLTEWWKRSLDLCRW